MQMPAKVFYDEHPFDWVGSYNPQALSRTLAPLLVSAIDEAPAPALIFDVGCGAGRVMSYMARRGLRCIGLDLSRISVRLMTERARRPGIVANNLELPLADGTIDGIVSDGVIHHTGDALRAFAENCRVLKSGGFFYLAVYKPGGRYQALYKFPGEIIRKLVGYRVGKLLLNLTAIPLYYFVHLVKSRGATTWRGAHNLFYDYFVTPRVVFLSYAEIEAAARKHQVEISKYEGNSKLNVHSFILRKR